MGRTLLSIVNAAEYAVDLEDSEHNQSGYDKRPDSAILQQNKRCLRLDILRNPPNTI